MLALAIVVLALVIFLVVVSFVGTSEEVVIDFANVTITASAGEVFVSGVAAGLVALASLVALKISLRGLWNRRKEVRELRRQVGAAEEHGAPDRTAAGPEHEEGSAAAQPTEEAEPSKDEPAKDTTSWAPPDEEGARESGEHHRDGNRS